MKPGQAVCRLLHLAAAAILLATGGATAQETLSDREVDIVTAANLDLIIAALERNGFQVELTEDTNGSPYIRSTDRSAPFSISFYNCSEGTDCGTIQFSTGWDLEYGITLARIEEWNAAKIWGVASRDQNKDPWLSMSINLRGGVTLENLTDSIDWWRVIMPQFEEHIGWAAAE